MPRYRKRPRVRHRSTSRFRRYFRRPKTIPIAPIAGFGAGLLLTGPADWGSPIKYFQAGDWEGAGRVLLNNLTGIQAYQGGSYNMDLMKIINPVDLSRAGAIKGLFWGMIAHRIANMVGQQRAFNGLPSPLKKLRI